MSGPPPHLQLGIVAAEFVEEEGTFSLSLNLKLIGSCAAPCPCLSGDRGRAPCAC